MKRKLIIATLEIVVWTAILMAGESPNIGDLQVFPQDNPWNWDISDYEVHPNSDNFIDSIVPDKNLHPDFGTVWQGAPNGIPYVVVNSSQDLVPIIYTHYGDESDPGPFPIPLNAPIEGGPESDGDRHVIAVDIENNMLYEIFHAYSVDGSWEARSGAKYDLTSNALRPAGWTSADAAGLPIFPGLVRYEEVYIKKEINHALRFTVDKTRRKYIYPARHFASTSDDPDYAPMGLRFRLKAEFDISDFSEPVQVILKALKKYGMIVADNGGDWFISGAPDDRWDDDVLGELKSIDGFNFEAVRTVDDEGNPIFPSVNSVTPFAPNKFEFKISNFPNPFNPETIIEYQVPHKSNISLKIYDVNGRLLETLVDAFQAEGNYKVVFNGEDLPSGVYFCQLQTESYSQALRMLLLK